MYTTNQYHEWLNQETNNQRGGRDYLSPKGKRIYGVAFVDWLESYTQALVVGGNKLGRTFQKVS